MDNPNLTTKSGAPSLRYLGCASLKIADARHKSGIYAIINDHDSNMYVGSSKNLAIRWTSHKSMLNRNKHYGAWLQRAWNKHGAESFRFVILKFCDVGALVQMEQYYITALAPTYNAIRKITSIPTGYPKQSPRNPFLGLDQRGDKNPMWGRKKPETAEFNRQTKKGRSYEEQHGVERAQQIKQKLSEQRKGSLNGHYGKGKAILQLSLDGQVIKQFANAWQAQLALGITHQSIRLCAKGVYKQAGGFRWQYV